METDDLPLKRLFRDRSVLVSQITDRAELATTGRVLGIDRNTLLGAARLTCVVAKRDPLLTGLVRYITTIESLRLSIFLKSSPGTFFRSSIALNRPCFSRN